MKFVLCVMAALVLAVAGHAFSQHRDQQQRMVTAWNKCAESIVIENDLIARLTKSLQTNPPWRVVDADAPRERAELIDKIVAEHRKRIKLLEEIKREDSR